MGVGALVVAPADVQPQLGGVDVAHGRVQGLHVQAGERLVLGVRLVLEHHVAAESQIRRVELQDEPGRGDGLVFGSHRLGQRVEVRLVVAVVGVGLEQRDDAGGRGVHERVVGAVSADRGGEVGDVALTRPHVLHRYGADALRPPVGRRPPGARLPLEEGGVVLEVGRRPPGAVALEPRDPVLDVGGVGELAHLAVADHVDPRADLPGDHLIHRPGHLGPVGVHVDGLFPLDGEHAAGHGLRAGQRAHMGGEDAVGAGLHVFTSRMARWVERSKKCRFSVATFTLMRSPGRARVAAENRPVQRLSPSSPSS